MTSSMKGPSKKEASLSNQESAPSQPCPPGVATSEDDNSEEDLYRAAEDLEQERQEKSQPHAEKSSVAAPECLLSYARREWKGNTAKSLLIRKGYEATAWVFESLRRVRGDNYCALRATLFQLLGQSRKVPAWLQDPEILKWPKQVQCVQDLVAQWRFPFGSRDGEGGAVERLERCLKLLRSRWLEAVECVHPAERERMCQQVFEGTLDEYEMLEALKFLMLHTAVQLHGAISKGLRVPEFCWLLFARDTSKCPRTFFTNHLRHVGFSGGLEQVEMFLLGYSLQQTIQVYRLYKTDSEEFVTYYPDDHKPDWPCLSLVTEDDRHYNILVPKQDKQLYSKFDESGRSKMNHPSGSQAQKQHVTRL
ncbi:OTU deubiquitinase with linear linkage specificity b isoform X2 [Electrophorus electricus]|uniref:OTU deubiquitinase with linear linkage specificity b isoform X2 n=1 Tax=Electrophorus electricus TaxID=8005 RepID=UPI000F0A080A|nr:OTU deubiquitinase with linear linkage specificity b isoform X2 [Electrophorus electricus]